MMALFAGRAPSRHPQTPSADWSTAYATRTATRTSGLKLAKLQFNTKTLITKHNVLPPIIRRPHTMPPKQRTPASVGPQTTTATYPPARSTKSASGNNAQDILQGIWSKYVNKTPQRVKLLDTFMVFLMVVGALQFLYVVLVGNFVRTHHPSSALKLFGHMRKRAVRR
jgi:hypothetical protein